MAKRTNEYAADEVRIYRERGAEEGAMWAEANGDDGAIVRVARERSASITDADCRRAWFRGFVDAANEVFGL
jgi:hypothetical protein